jgi:hypothetical protein
MRFSSMIAKRIRSRVTSLPVPRLFSRTAIPRLRREEPRNPVEAMRCRSKRWRNGGAGLDDFPAKWSPVHLEDYGNNKREPRSNSIGPHQVLAVTSVLAVSLLSFAPLAKAAPPRTDPSWPCQQIKVPTISLAAVWSGPAIDGLADKANGDPELADLVARLAARRTPIQEAQGLLDAFSAKAGADKRSRLLIVFAGVFEELNRERDQVMAGLARVARRQVDFAQKIRAENHDFLDLRDKPDADPAKLKEMSDRIDWDMRVFDDRSRSISYACEVPTLIEQRLFAVARMIEAKLD